MPDLFFHAGTQEAEGRRRQMLRTAFGPAIAAALADPTVNEVMANPDGKLWIESVPAGRRDSGQRIGAAEAERISRAVPHRRPGPAGAARAHERPQQCV